MGCIYQAFFYTVGLSEDTRKNIRDIFDFKEDCINSGILEAEWQTSGSLQVCRFAFNLWNGYIDPDDARNYIRDSLFGCSYAPFFWQGIQLRYPEYTE